MLSEPSGLGSASEKRGHLLGVVLGMTFVGAGGVLAGAVLVDAALGSVLFVVVFVKISPFLLVEYVKLSTVSPSSVLRITVSLLLLS